MIVKRHVWRAIDGRLVPHEHPDAALLAYPAGTEVADAEAARVGLTPELAGHPAPPPEPEPESPAQVKQAATHEDKAAEPAPVSRRRPRAGA